MLRIEWKETGGPEVSLPVRQGYGSSVIGDLLPYELGGTVDVAFAASGVRCTIETASNWRNDWLIAKLSGTHRSRGISGTVHQDAGEAASEALNAPAADPHSTVTRALPWNVFLTVAQEYAAYSSGGPTICNKVGNTVICN